MEVQIGITALDAYDRTKQKSNLELGKLIFDFMMTGYNNVLDGGIYWKEGSLSSKNTCSKGPGVLVAIQLYQATKDKSYLDAALKIFNWTNTKLQALSGSKEIATRFLNKIIRKQLNIHIR